MVSGSGVATGKGRGGSIMPGRYSQRRAKFNGPQNKKILGILYDFRMEGGLKKGIMLRARIELATSRLSGFIKRFIQVVTVGFGCLQY